MLIRVDSSPNRSLNKRRKVTVEQGGEGNSSSDVNFLIWCVELACTKTGPNLCHWVSVRRQNVRSSSRLTRLVLLPLGAADGSGEFWVSGQPAHAPSVPFPPIVGVAAVADALATVGARQGQGTALGRERESILFTSPLPSNPSLSCSSEKSHYSTSYSRYFPVILSVIRE